MGRRRWTCSRHCAHDCAATTFRGHSENRDGGESWRWQDGNGQRRGFRVIRPCGNDGMPLSDVDGGHGAPRRRCPNGDLEVRNEEEEVHLHNKKKFFSNISEPYQPICLNCNPPSSLYYLFFISEDCIAHTSSSLDDGLCRPSAPTRPPRGSRCSFP